MMKRRGTALAAVTMIGLLLPGASHGQDPIAARQEGFKASKAAMGAIKDIVASGGPVDAVVPHAEKLHHVALAVPGLFPAGSDQGKTEAKTTIWSDAAGFAAASARFQTASEALLAAAQAGDAVAVKARFGEVGSSCKSCHDSYRAE